ncbi:hypothetical protein QCA50_000335 [Cerrena zonata]|uniref:Uncharacterized protein n=1 Tax=Cerrena zonata TaxID=2478898 RepID=A0AAW0GUM5_9APHY
MRRYSGLAQAIKKEEKYRTASPASVPSRQTRGVERLNPPKGISNTELWKVYIIPKSRELKNSGKRLVGTPRVLPDGVIFEWILDHEIAEDGETDQLIQCDGSYKESVSPKRRWHSLPAGTGSHLSGTGLLDDPICLDEVADDRRQEAPLPGERLKAEGTNPVPDTHGSYVSSNCNGHVAIPEATPSTENDSEETDSESDSSNPDEEVFKTGSPRHNPSLQDSDLENYGADLLSAGEPSRKALSKLEREGKLPSTDALSLSLRVGSPLNPINTVNKAKAANTSYTVSHHQDIRPQKIRRLSGKRPSRESSSSDQEIVPTKRVRVRPTRVIHSPTSGSDGESSDDLSPVRRKPAQSSHSQPSLRKRALSASSGRYSGSETSDSASSSDSDPMLSHYAQERLASEQGLIVRLPKPNHARARRLLLPSDTTLPLACVYMRADVQFLNRRDWLRMRGHSLPCEETRLVSDACLVNDRIVVLGYDAGPNNPKVSLVPIDETKPRRIDILHRGFGKVNESNSSGFARPSRGITALCSLRGDRMQFLSGGQDRSIRLWTITSVEEGYQGKSREVAASYPTEVQAIAFRAQDDLLFSGGGKRIHTTHLPSGHIRGWDNLSNPLVQIHVNSSNESLVSLELDHLDSQIALYDTRKGGFSRKPCLDFGYREPSKNLNKRPGRFFHKGSVEGYHYARGYGDGAVCVWDIRKVDKVILKLTRKHEKAAVHTVLSGDVVMAYGDISVSCWDICSGDPRHRQGRSM